MNVDPRLQSFPFNDPNSFNFPSHPPPPQFDPNLHAYGIDLNQQQQTTRPVGASPQRAALRNGTSSPQTPMRGGQAPAPNQRISSPSTTQPAGPRRQSTNPNAPKQNRNNLVFKNSTSAHPYGGSSTVTTDPNVFSVANLPSNLSHNTSADYFSAQNTQPPTTVPDADLGPPTPPPTHDSANPFSSTFPLITDPPHLSQWRERLFNITSPIHLTHSQFLTYFPHIDNVYSHRSTQRYKRKPFLSHYWDCRLKGRPSGTKKSLDPNIKRRKREKRELGLCHVKIKITEWFSREEAEQMGLSAVALGEAEASFGDANMVESNLQFVMQTDSPANNGPVLTNGARWPRGHPGGDGKKWFTIQRVNVGKKGDDEEGEDEDDGGDEEGGSLDHKHALEESDRIKKNSVQRQMIKEEKDRKNSKKINPLHSLHPPQTQPSSLNTFSTSTYLASGPARATVRLHAPTVPTHLTFYANAFCPFAQRVWIALELKNIPYQLVEITPEMIKSHNRSIGSKDDSAASAGASAVDHGVSAPSSTSGASPAAPVPAELLSVNPQAVLPCIKHGNWGIWESNVMMEYLEDLFLDMGQNVGGIPLLPVGQPQLKAHCRLWVDHVNRKVLPSFYALLLTPPPRRRSSANGDVTMNGAEGQGGDGGLTAEETAQNEARSERLNMLITTLQQSITALVNASHAIGPFFLGDTISFVDVAFAPWIIRLSRVLSYYRNFPRPEVGTRWQSWVEAIEGDERVRRTVSEEKSYHGVYRGVGEDGCGVEGLKGREDGQSGRRIMVEMDYARKIVSSEGFGLGGDLYGRLGVDLASRCTEPLVI